jgi:hypothetical protein
LRNLAIEVFEKSLPGLAIFNTLKADINTKGGIIIKVLTEVCFILAFVLGQVFNFQGILFGVVFLGVGVLVSG